MKRAQALSILYDLTLAIGGEIKVLPLLETVLQRLMYHTGFPVGVILARRPESAPLLELVIGDFELSRRVGSDVGDTHLTWPSSSRLVTGGDCSDALGCGAKYPYCLMLPIDEQYAILLLSATEPSHELPLETLFQPALRNLSRALMLCRNYEASTQSLMRDRDDAKDALETALASARHERNFLQLLFKTIPDLVWLKDAEGRYLACNPNFERLYGHTQAEIIGKDDYDFVDRELADFFRKNDRIAIDKGAPSINEEWLTFADGSHEGLFETIKTPMYDENGSLIGVLGVARDISDIKRNERLAQEGAERFNALLSSSTDSYVSVDLDGNILEVNEESCRQYGYTRDELLQLNIADIDANDDAATIRELIQVIAGREDGLIFSKLHRRKNGSMWPVEISVSYSKIDGGRLFAFMRDISKRTIDEKLTSLRQKLADQLYNSDVAGLLRSSCNLANELTYAHHSCFVLLDASENIVSRVYSTNIAENDSSVATEDWQLCRQRREPIIVNQAGSRRLCVPIWRDRRLTGVFGIFGRDWDFEASDQSIVEQAGEIALDFVDRKRAEEQIQFMAFNDTLTGLPNRQLFADRIHQAISHSKRSGALLAIVYLDLDGFKPINDKYGHQVGDQLLIQLARRLGNELRDEDTLARMGGDEFVMLLNDLSSIQAGETIMERVLHLIAQPFDVDGHRMHISASLGATYFPNDNADPDTLLRHADQAMYAAKESGKNAFSLYDPIRSEKEQAEQAALGRIASALRDAELVLHYQPRIDLRTGTLAGVEALVRWQHPEKGLQMPAQFLPIIRNSALEIALDEWVIREATRQHLEWREIGLVIPVSINISPRHIQHDTFPDFLKSVLDECPADMPQNIELEILETSAIGDTGHVSRIMFQCAELGVSFSLDDFGTGYSSLTYFHRLPISVLKIDQHFVRQMLDDARDQDIVEGVLRLAEALDRPVVAEGVENIELGIMLGQLGCQYAQGYGISRPMPPAELPLWVDRWNNAPGPWRRLVSAARGPTPYYDLNVSIFSHELWLESVISAIESGDADIAPELDHQRCQFARWYRGIGLIRYGLRPAYQKVADQHHVIHDLALELVRLSEQQGPARASARVSELKDASQKLFRLLQQLSQ